MIKLITELTLNMDTDFKLSTFEAELLLSKLEEFGMMPPSYKIECDDSVDCAGNTIEYNSYVEEWEPED